MATRWDLLGALQTPRIKLRYHAMHHHLRELDADKTNHGQSQASGKTPSSCCWEWKRQYEGGNVNGNRIGWQAPSDSTVTKDESTHHTVRYYVLEPPVEPMVESMQATMCRCQHVLTAHLVTWSLRRAKVTGSPHTAAVLTITIAFLGREHVRHCFQCSPLDLGDVRQLKQLARQVAQEAVSTTCRRSLSDLAPSQVKYAFFTTSPINWHLSSDDQGIQIYSGVDNTAPPNVSTWMSVSTLQASLDDVARMSYCESTAEYKQFIDASGSIFTEGARLYNIERPTHDNPHDFIGVNWLKQTSKLNGMGIKPRDFCVVEIHQDTKIQGTRAWVRAMRSIKLREEPYWMNSPGVIRGEIYRFGAVFVETNQPNLLQVFHLTQINPKGRVNDLIVKFHASRYINSMAKKLSGMLRSYRLSCSGFKNECDLVPKASRQRCGLCNKAFNLLLPKARCRKCGEVVCWGCSKVWLVRDCGIPTKRRVCTACCVNVASDIISSTALSTPEEEKKLFIVDDDDGEDESVDDVGSDVGESLVCAPQHSSSRHVYRPDAAKLLKAYS
ncbi:hypothetical protein AeNC1_005466 [Aphanomyces euteiches]|nr:hypothetical protein AeNC1_005466 [Aphanomyces euteiches]